MVLNYLNRLGKVVQKTISGNIKCSVIHCSSMLRDAQSERSRTSTSQTFLRNKFELMNKIFRRIQLAREEISSSDFYSKCIQTINQGKRTLENIDIVSYGLGQFSQCATARYQFAFLLILKDHYKAKVFVYDPIFSPDEIEIAKHFDCTVIDNNEEGKRQIINTTLFFLPHCPKQLANNLLWRNWNKDLSKCIIISNSFGKIIESNSDRFLKENLQFVFHASSFVREFKIDNCFKFEDIFNDLSLHVFLEEDIEHLAENILNLKKEPIYQENDIEFITKSILDIST